MNLTLHQMKVFTTVVEIGSVSLAAEKLHMTQPAVSNILKQLQSFYDCKLTEFVARKMYLTAYGEILYKSFIDLQKQLEATSNKINLLKGAVVGTLNVATVSTAKYFMPNILGKFREEFPAVAIKLSVTNRQGVIERLQNNLDDFTVMSHPPDNMQTMNTCFYEDELVVIAANRYQSGGKSTLDDLKHVPWLMREKGSGTLYAIEHIFKEQHFSPKTVVEIGDNEAIKQSVIANFGISIISKASCHLEITEKLLQVVRVHNFPVRHNWYVVRNKGKFISPLVEKFLQYMYEHQH